MTFPTPSVRSACDRCHQKKVRCVSTRQQQVCDRCADHRTSCVFSPAGRNGRPPRARRPVNGTSYRVQPISRSFPISNNPSIIDGDEPTVPTPTSLELQGGPEIASSLSNVSPLTASHVPQNLDSVWVDVNAVEFDQAGQIGAIDSLSSDAIQQFLQRTPTSMTDQVNNPTSSYAEDNTTTTFQPQAGDEILFSLQEFQRRFHAELRIRNLSTSTPSSSSSSFHSKLDFGGAFQLLDELQTLIGQHLDTLTNSRAEAETGPRPFDFSIAMAITTILGNAAEAYERIAHGSDLTIPAAAPTNSQNSSSSSTLSSSAVSIGGFTPPEPVTRRILVVVLLHQLLTCQQLLGRFYQYLSPTTTTAGRAHNDFFFTPDLKQTIAQLLDQIRRKIERLERRISTGFNSRSEG